MGKPGQCLFFPCLSIREVVGEVLLACQLGPRESMEPCLLRGAVPAHFLAAAAWVGSLGKMKMNMLQKTEILVQGCSPHNWWKMFSCYRNQEVIRANRKEDWVLYDLPVCSTRKFRCNAHPAVPVPNPGKQGNISSLKQLGAYQ